MPSSSDQYQTPRRVLRPGTTVEDVDAFAQLLRWPVAEVTERDRAAGTDGRVTWRGDGPAALHYLEDAMFGIGHYVVSGPRAAAEDTAAQAAEALDAFTVKELCAAVDEAPDARARGQATVWLGLAAGGDDDADARSRLAVALTDREALVRYAALFAVAYAGAAPFAATIRKMAEGDPEPRVRDRAAELLRDAR
ncbi:hypothetical protein [Actinomadura flavalba]|uniref:hypothetical protein n=1 Tax=Actinomadura flavalba TaxID=1120938 RepID=UPI001F0A7B11|nr:hypothetical protein [Actinomadura flavalba]